MDAVVCLFDDAEVILTCNDDTDTFDSLVYAYLEAGDYYLRVTQFDGSQGGQAYYYELILSSPLLISANQGGKVGGIPFRQPTSSRGQTSTQATRSGFSSSMLLTLASLRPLECIPC
ncbi:MAG: hypothetical protein R3C44_19615 [Chloroflexota bacterium]